MTPTQMIIIHPPYRHQNRMDVEPFYATGGPIHYGLLQAQLMIDSSQFGYIPTTGLETLIIVRRFNLI
jgi:hypothetical protein